MRFCSVTMVVVLLLCNCAWAQLQAQEGWGKPRLVTTLSATGGLVLDAKHDTVLALEETGLSQINLKTAIKGVLIEKRGLKELRGVSSAWGMMAAWGERNLSSDDALRVGWLQNSKLETEAATINGIPSAKTVLASATGPVALWAESLGADTVIYFKNWRKRAQIVYRTKLSIGALEAARNPGGTYSFLFAEGYRNAQDEKFDAVLLTGTLERLERRVLGPAVYARGQRYLLVQNLVQNPNGAIPIWWWETPEDQRIAALTRSHNPLLAYWNGERAIPFGTANTPIASENNELFWSDKNTIFSANLKRLERAKQLLLSPDTISAAQFDNTDTKQMFVWQSVNQDGFSSNLYVADTLEPYRPNLIDRISVMLGWNPWYPGTSALGQTAASLLMGAFGMFFITPIAFLLSSKFGGAGIKGFRLGLILAWIFGVGIRFLSGLTAPNSGDFAFRALLEPSWWVVLFGLLLGSTIAVLNRKRFIKLELSAIITAGLVTLIATTISGFSRIGFLQF
jgi:hypothetical protein